ASAQLLAAKEGPVAYGHHHLNVTNVEEAKKFFATALGGTAIKVGTNNAEIVKFPNVLIFFRQQAPTGGSQGSAADHIPFSPPHLRPVVHPSQAGGLHI